MMLIHTEIIQKNFSSDSNDSIGIDAFWVEIDCCAHQFIDHQNLNSVVNKWEIVHPTNKAWHWSGIQKEASKQQEEE